METRTTALYAFIRNAARRASERLPLSVSRRTFFKKLSRSTRRRNVWSFANEARFRRGSFSCTFVEFTATVVCFVSSRDRTRMHRLSVAFGSAESEDSSSGQARRASLTHPGFVSKRRRNKTARSPNTSSFSEKGSSSFSFEDRATRTTVPQASRDAHIRSTLRFSIVRTSSFFFASFVEAEEVEKAASVASRNATPSKHRA
mmetsp:Transcript_9679/g.40583  ORF Transcript_9679/g.40583 Transcript_9679/m.40583 type:complete len:202 (+) Transcript_9679:1457-2062(+)